MPKHETTTLTDLILETREIEEQGGACPYQATGTILGKPFYFRFRNDCASLKVGDDEEYEPEATGQSMSGFLTGDEFEELFKLLLRRILKKYRR